MTEDASGYDKYAARWVLNFGCRALRLDVWRCVFPSVVLGYLRGHDQAYSAWLIDVCREVDNLYWNGGVATGRDFTHEDSADYLEARARKVLGDDV